MEGQAMITLKIIHDMIATMRGNDIPPKTDKHGQYYNLHLQSEGREIVYKAYFTDQPGKRVHLEV